jgi:uncharacterized protein involved in exopolysaccharide biosynthesis
LHNTQNTSIEKRVEGVEREIDMLKTSAENDLTLQQLLSLFKKHRMLFLKVSASISVLFLLIAFFMSKTYEASTILAPSNDNASSASRIPAQYGGLVAMAGVSLGDAGSNRVEQSVVLVKSWPFWADLLAQHSSLKPKLLAVVGEEQNTGALVFDSGIYDDELSQWEDMEPSSFKAFRAIKKQLTATYDAQTGMVTIEFKHRSPSVAYETIRIIVEELNEHFKEQDKLDAQRSINLLREKIAQTKNTEMRIIFYNLIEAHTKTLLLTDVRDEYLLKTLVRPMLPESGSNLRRIAVGFFGILFSIFVGASTVLFRHLGSSNHAQSA